MMHGKGTKQIWHLNLPALSLIVKPVSLVVVVVVEPFSLLRCVDTFLTSVEVACNVSLVRWNISIVWNLKKRKGRQQMPQLCKCSSWKIIDLPKYFCIVHSIQISIPLPSSCFMYETRQASSWLPHLSKAKPFSICHIYVSIKNLFVIFQQQTYLTVKIIFRDCINCLSPAQYWSACHVCWLMIAMEWTSLWKDCYKS